MNAEQFVMIFIQKTKTKIKELKENEIISIVSNIIHPKKYIKIRDKQKIVEDIILKTVSQGEHLELYYNSFDKYLLTMITLINTYTDLNIDENGYDVLCGNGVLEYVLSSFSKEYEVFMGIMNLYMESLTNHSILLSELKGGELDG